MTAASHLKICGITSVEDARLANASGADYLGVLVDVGFSDRSLSLPEARTIAAAVDIKVVVLMCDPDPEAVREVAAGVEPYAIQFLGVETPQMLADLKSELDCRIWKTVHLSGISGQAAVEEYVRAGVDALLVDSAEERDGLLRLGGTGKLADWTAAADLIKSVSLPVFLAGGIDPDNIERALWEVRPYGIDLCSGVESHRGKKDPDKLRTLVDNYRNALNEIERGG
ncbi:phosphoribosylanthranilate isomerase [candidate division KSB1 bacterium]